jgi:hypothetical protein
VQSLAVLLLPVGNRSPGRRTDGRKGDTQVQISRWILVAVGIVLGVALALPIQAQSAKQLKAAKKLLEKLKLVDGAGSGLDADTVQA